MLPEDMCDVVKLYLHFWNIYSSVHRLPGLKRRDHDQLQKYLFPENLRLIFLLCSLNVQIILSLKRLIFIYFTAIEMHVMPNYQRSF